jgi:hypothetical protein
VASIDSGRKMTWSRLDRDGVGEAGRRGLGLRMWGKEQAGAG